MSTGTKLRILVVDDNRSAADALARVLRRSGDDVDTVYDGAAAIEHLQRRPPHLILTDLRMEPVDGIAVLEAARAMRPPIEVVVFTAYGAVDVAVRAMRLGARDFLTKPVTVEQVSARIEQLRDSDTNKPLEELSFVARSQAAQQLEATLRRVANVPSAVWIEGEVGTGRVFAAQALHKFGDASRPLVVREATVDQDWPTHGTLVLPNVDDLPDDLQRNLVRRLSNLPPELRVIATASPDGRKAVADGRLRADLYYKLSVVLVQVPPLRQRREDILPLFEQGLATFANRYRRPIPRLSPEQGSRLEQHTWPGNIRELLNLAERTVVLGPEAADVDVSEPDLSSAGLELPSMDNGFSLSDYLDDVEKRLIIEALRRAGGDRNQAGRLLGVERNTLRYKLNKYGLLDR